MKIIKESEREKITEKYYNLIHSRAHSFNRTTGINYEDLFSVASLGFVMALNDYDSSKGASFSTFAYIYMTNELFKFINSEQLYKDTFKLVPHIIPE